MKKLSQLEEELALHLRAVKLPRPEREFHFAAHHVGRGAGIRKRLAAAGLRDWRFDFAWPRLRIAVECEGGAWMKKGGHTTGKGFADDLRKYDAAMRLYWNVYRCDQDMITSGRAIGTIKILIDYKLSGGE